MNFLSKLFKKKEPLVTKEYSGELISKKRHANPPKSYSLYMPQTMLDSAYNDDPDRYDLFSVTLSGCEPVSIPQHLWEDLKVGKKYLIKIKEPNSELSFRAFLEQLSNIFYDIKEIK